ncbi:mCG1027758 [Mus musculus]|nr:mCG1027758 [Mus musculus]
MFPAWKPGLSTERFLDMLIESTVTVCLSGIHSDCVTVTAGMRHSVLRVCHVHHHQVWSALPLCDVTVILCVVTSSLMTSHHLPLS